ncbi:MAG: AAA family ATPase, partial [Planctomycetes bacterium]|nr:AAA family ATPase [Planctomycetota bacterium]
MEKITILGVKIDRFLRLTAARVKVDPDAGLIRVTGPNKAGKTSLLRGIAASIGGGKEVPDDPLHEDSETGAITLNLSNGYTVERRFTKTGSGLKGYLKVVGPDGEEMKQTALNDWLGPRSFDPLHFFSLSANEQREVLLGLDPDLVTVLEKIDNGIRTMESERLPHNSLIQKVQRMDAPDGIRPEKIDVTAEMSRLDELEKQQENHQLLADALIESSDTIKGHEDNIKRLEAELTVERQKLENEELRREQLREEMKGHRPVQTDIEQLKGKIAGANQVNEALAPWEEYDRAQVELGEAREASEKFTERIDALKGQKKTLLEQLTVGVEGLGFDEEGDPTLNGHPMDQASGRE